MRAMLLRGCRKDQELAAMRRSYSAPAGACAICAFVAIGG